VGCVIAITELRLPYWLTGHAADDIVGQRLDAFCKAHDEFMEIFEEEEELLLFTNGVPSYRSNIMRVGR
jgi:hypothetical protein